MVAPRFGRADLSRTMPDNPAADQPLGPWPPTEPRELGWRRVVKLRGKMPIEVMAGEDVVGRLIAADFWGKDYRVDTRDAAWRFIAHGPGRRRCVAGPREDPPTAAIRPDVILARGERAGFRLRHVWLKTGPRLEWRQLGIQGRRYRLALPNRGPELLIARNTGGPLRWSGTVEVREPALALGPALPLVVLFSTFLVFNSDELGF